LNFQFSGLIVLVIICALYRSLTLWKLQHFWSNSCTAYGAVYFLGFIGDV